MMQGGMIRTKELNAFGNALGNDIAGRMQGSPKPKSNIPDGYTAEEWAKYQKMNGKLIQTAMINLSWVCSATDRNLLF